MPYRVWGLYLSPGKHWRKEDAVRSDAVSRRDRPRWDGKPHPRLLCGMRGRPGSVLCVPLCPSQICMGCMSGWMNACTAQYVWMCGCSQRPPSRWSHLVGFPRAPRRCSTSHLGHPSRLGFSHLTLPTSSHIFPLSPSHRARILQRGLPDLHPSCTDQRVLRRG